MTDRQMQKIALNMEKDFSILPEIPQDLTDKIEEDFRKSDKILYKRNGSTASYHCTRCGADYERRIKCIGYPDVSYKIPVKGEVDICKACRNAAVLVPRGRFKKENLWNYYYLWQEIPGGIVLRYFETYKENSIYRDKHTDVRELARAFYYLGEQRNYTNYKSYEWETDAYVYRWEYNKNFSFLQWFTGTTVGNPLLLYKHTPLKYCPVDEMIDIYKKAVYEREVSRTLMRIFETYSNWPGIEMEIKTGMRDIVRHHLFKYGIDGKLRKKAKKPCEIYKVYPERMKNLRDCTVSRWEVYQYEKKQSLSLSEDEVDILEDAKRRGVWSGYIKILKYMSIEKALNYIKRVESEYKYKDEIIIEYTDYLSIRNELGYDMSNTVYLFPKSLKKAHNKMVKERKDREDNKRIDEVLQMFPEIKDRYKRLNKKYRFESDGYVIRPAKDAAEIVHEGWDLHHCVGGNNYLSKHNTGKSAILFLRSDESPDVSYVTIEVKDGKILQWYGAHDSKDVSEECISCIEKFEKMIQKYDRNLKRTENISAGTADMQLLQAAV